jgi:hypothetical protein
MYFAARAKAPIKGHLVEVAIGLSEPSQVGHEARALLSQAFLAN